MQEIMNQTIAGGPQAQNKTAINEEERLEVSLLVSGAKAPTVAHPHEDLGYDLYSAENKQLLPGAVYKVRTGIAANALLGEISLGLLIRDRSSMASAGVFTHGGVIDAGYRGEVIVLMTTLFPYMIEYGQRIAQMVPVPVLTGEVFVKSWLDPASRGGAGFGSTGK